MPKGVKQPFPDGWNELKVPGLGWTAVRILVDDLGLPVGIEYPTEPNGRHIAFRRERRTAAAELAGMKVVEENVTLRREVERLRKLLGNAANGPLPSSVS